MPEIAEVARVVHFIRQHLVGRTIRKVTAQEDSNVFGKVGCTAAQVEEALTGKKLVGARQQGKYFWFELSSPPQLLMHFSMTGWFHIKGVRTGYREAGQDKEEPQGDADWPPKYVKFEIEMDDGQRAAFVDSRRFGRVRLVDCAPEKMRQTSPLKENGPDPVVDKDKVSVEFLENLCARKKAPIKAVLLDQGNISGIGNWVSDEVFYDAKMHPEQYSNTLSKAQIKQLHKSIHHVCGLACKVLGDSSKFPEEWLFKWRWGKGKKDAPQYLPNGQKIQHLTVGGRTSAIIPSVQKKTGVVAGEVEEDDGNNEEEEKPKKRKKEPVGEDESDDNEKESAKKKKSAPPKPGRATTKPKAQPAKLTAPAGKAADTPASKKRKSSGKGEGKIKAEPGRQDNTSGRRRSSRLNG